ncbi:MAG: DoxX family protein [Bacteroidetes bacterium HGW-Bacteroidetes-15]|nr:MAG: DoxX family protein [Bacteroidetes bacterium HGW-Bacteroidetes-15]
MKTSNSLQSTIARILFAIPFGVIGINHFFVIDFFKGMLTSFIPGGGFTVVFTGALLVAASISIILKKYIVISCWLLTILLGLFILTIHIPNLFTYQGDEMQFVIMQLIKDTSLMGGALLIASIYKDEEK